MNGEVKFFENAKKKKFFFFFWGGGVGGVSVDVNEEQKFCEN